MSSNANPAQADPVFWELPSIRRTLDFLEAIGSRKSFIHGHQVYVLPAGAFLNSEDIYFAYETKSDESIFVSQFIDLVAGAMGKSFDEVISLMADVEIFDERID